MKGKYVMCFQKVNVWFSTNTKPVFIHWESTAQEDFIHILSCFFKIILILNFLISKEITIKRMFVNG